MFHEISTKRMLDASKLFSCTFRVPPRDIRVIVRMVFVYLVFFVFTGKLKIQLSLGLLKRPVGPEDTQPNGKRSDALGCRGHQDGDAL